MHVWSDLFFALMVPLLPFIKEDMNLTFTEVGLLRSVFAGSSAVLQIPAGFLGEVMGEFWPLIAGNLWVSIGLIGMALSPIFVVLLVVSFVGGLGGGTQHPMASSMVARAYDNKGRSTAVGTVNFSGDLGKMIAPAAAGSLAVYYDWRTAMMVIGIAGIVFMVVTALTRWNVDIGQPTRRAASPAESGSDGVLDIQMAGFLNLTGLGFLDSTIRSGVLAFLPFVMVAKEMSPGQISTMLVLLFAGGAAGKFVVGWLGDRYGMVNLVLGTKGLTAALLATILAVPAAAMAPLMVALGAGLNGTSSVLYATVADFVPARRRARFYGVFYTSNEGGSVLGPLVYGRCADLFTLNVAVVVMAVVTVVILPFSLTLRKYIVPKVAGPPLKAS